MGCVCLTKVRPEKSRSSFWYSVIAFGHMAINGNFLCMYFHKVELSFLQMLLFSVFSESSGT